MLKQILIIGSFIVITIILSGCINQELICNEPYIQVGDECCLDQNSNNICDTDEDKEENISGDQNNDLVYTKNKLNNLEIRSIVYGAIRTNIPQSTPHDFEYKSLLSNTRCYREWWYPSLNYNASEYVIYSLIQECHDDEAYSLDELYELCSNCKLSEDYIRNLQNGEVLIHDRIVELPGNTTRYDYSVEIVCKGKYNIAVTTHDFVGENAWPIYEDYNINKLAMEKVANDILGGCKQS